VTQRRTVIVHIATSADGFIAQPDGDLDWLTSRPARNLLRGRPCVRACALAALI